MRSCRDEVRVDIWTRRAVDCHKGCYSYKNWFDIGQLGLHDVEDAANHDAILDTIYVKIKELHAQRVTRALGC